MRDALCESTLSGGLESDAMTRRGSFSKRYTHSNIQLNKKCALWMYSEWWASSRSSGFREKFFKTLYTFKHTTEQSLRSVEVHWVVGFKQKQWLSGEIFQNTINIQAYNWTNYSLCESTLTGGIQAEAMARIRNFSKYYTHSNIQLNKLCALWKYTDWWASCRSNGFQTNLFETLYTFKHTTEQSVRSVKVHWGVGFKQKQWLSDEFFRNIVHIQTYNGTECALCESTLRGGLQAEAMAFRRSFSKHYTRPNIQLNKVCALWKYIEWWASIRSNCFRKKIFKKIIHIQTYNWKKCALCQSNKVTWVVGFKQKQWLSEEVFWNIIHMQLYNWTKYALCESTLSGGLQAEKNGFQKKFFETLYTCKHTIEQNMRYVKVHRVVGFKQKQWLSEEVFQNTIHIQT